MPRIFYGASCARRFARRRFRIRRPALVAMRALKPCVRARLIRLGWNVRFICLNPEGTATLRSQLKKKAGKRTRQRKLCQ